MLPLGTQVYIERGWFTFKNLDMYHVMINFFDLGFSGIRYVIHLVNKEIHETNH